MSDIIDINNIIRSARLLAEENMLEHKGIVRTARDVERMQKLMDDFAPSEEYRIPKDVFARQIFTGKDRTAMQGILGERIDSDIKKLNDYVHSDLSLVKDLVNCYKVKS